MSYSLEIITKFTLKVCHSQEKMQNFKKLMLSLLFAIFAGQKN
mgnify:CR=1 FL=1